MPKLMSEGICTYFNKAIVQSMFKHTVSGNGPLVLGYVHTVPDSEMERRRKCTG